MESWPHWPSYHTPVASTNVCSYENYCLTDSNSMQFESPITHRHWSFFFINIHHIFLVTAVFGVFSPTPRKVLYIPIYVWYIWRKNSCNPKYRHHIQQLGATTVQIVWKDIMGYSDTTLNFPFSYYKTKCSVCRRFNSYIMVYKKLVTTIMIFLRECCCSQGSY